MHLLRYSRRLFYPLTGNPSATADAVAAHFAYPGRFSFVGWRGIRLTAMKLLHS